VRNDAGRGRAEQEARDAVEPALADHDQIEPALVGRVDDRLGDMADRLDRLGLVAEALELRDGLVELAPVLLDIAAGDRPGAAWPTSQPQRPTATACELAAVGT
jgi:hypothetical protein